MRLPRLRPRLRLRTLLIAVAVMGVGLGGWTIWKRREYCLELANRYRVWVQNDLKTVEVAEIAVVEYGASDKSNDAMVSQLRENVALAREQLRANLRMAARYRYVADHSWLPLPRGPE